jgi:hypothetical protein
MCESGNSSYRNDFAAVLAQTVQAYYQAVVYTCSIQIDQKMQLESAKLHSADAALLFINACAIFSNSV